MSTLCRTTASAWLVGGGVWLAGLAGLTAFSDDMKLSDGGRPATANSYWTPTSVWSTYQDPTGRYSVVVRSYARVSGD